ncbi:hypothetical protein KY290_026879 [Solanum tuberosum]|uniref:RRM domain-containing protein n=1 Tax=Solanum tuberosum TaxID=4113 RepID=A0ABQ7UZF3_SOLTU|nr:hypothetical protein KY290_026879 [Solanum tuberosum]
MATITLLFFLLLQLITATISTTPPPYNATVFVLLNCGAQSATTDDTDRRWDTDTHFPNFLPSNFTSISTTATASEQDPSVNRVPYTTGARIMRSQFTYTFRVTPGTIFLRLYFYPANYSGFDKAESFFSVTANHLTLLSNFSAFLTVSASSRKQVQKEYVINVDETQILKLTFSPSPNSYAFVNGIEILSMPTDLYIHGDVKLAGNTNPYNINNSTALETLYRLNVGGYFVGSTEDTGMYRVWDSDDAFVVGYGYQTPHFDDASITYTPKTPAYTAPTIVYTTSRTMANYSPGLDWEFPLNSGFYYLFRLHFCEIQPEVKEINDRSFSISIGNQTAEREADVIQWSEGWRIPVYKDYVVNVRNQDGEQNVTLALSPNPNSAYQNAILNGLEIFKLNDSNGNLSVPNPEFFFPNNSPPNNNNKRSSSHIIAVITAVANALSKEHFLGNRMLEVKVATPKEEMRAPAKKVTRIFVARIPPSVSEATFRGYFEKYGEITDLYMPKDPSTKGHRGIGFITFANAESVDDLMNDTHELGGSTIVVDRATPKAKDFRPVSRMSQGGGGYGAYNAYMSATTRYGALGAPTLYDHPSSMYGRGGGGGGFPSRGGMGQKIFVGRLPQEATTEDLRQYFGRFGRVLDVYVPKDPRRPGHRGFGFVTFADDGVADRVSRRPHEICGHQVAIDSATPLDDAGPSNNYMMDPPPPAPEAYGGYGGPMRTYGRMYGGLDYDDWGYGLGGGRPSRSDMRYRPY